MSVTISNVDLNSIIIYSFRYCLGRKTYAVSDCVEFITKHWDTLYDVTKTLIKKEIRKAIKDGKAGDMCDISCWETVLEL